MVLKGSVVLDGSEVSLDGSEVLWKVLKDKEVPEVSYYKENLLSRDHTERMLNGMGACIKNTNDGWIAINPLDKPLRPLNITVPTDPSSAFFFGVAAAIMPDSLILVSLIVVPTNHLISFLNIHLFL